LLRTHLELIGLKDERPELFESTDERQQMRVHDLRGTFVTISLANGRSESWIADRTGHGSSAMIGKYKRTARSFQELGLGGLDPLDQAIPDLFSMGHDLGQTPKTL
jgi:integrase